jgi:hypothetical protein
MTRTPHYYDGHLVGPVVVSGLPQEEIFRFLYPLEFSLLFDHEDNVTRNAEKYQGTSWPRPGLFVYPCNELENSTTKIVLHPKRRASASRSPRTRSGSAVVPYESVKQAAPKKSTGYLCWLAVVVGTVVITNANKLGSISSWKKENGM